MKILFVTRDKKQLIPQFLDKYQNKKIVWKNKLSKKDFQNINLIITLGGDGTFLSAAHFISNQMILGVNTNPLRSEGHLTSIDIQSFRKKFNEIILGKFKIREYTREKIKIFKKDRCIQTENALNESYLGNLNPHHPSNYEIIYENNKEYQRSSGVLISTGTGSTAWYKAMKGWSYSKTKKQLRFRIRELFNGRLFKSKIKKGKINLHEKLILISKMNHGILAIDSIRTHKIRKDDRIEVTMGQPLKVIQ